MCVICFGGKKSSPAPVEPPKPQPVPVVTAIDPRRPNAATQDQAAIQAAQKDEEDKKAAAASGTEQRLGDLSTGAQAAAAVNAGSALMTG